MCANRSVVINGNLYRFIFLQIGDFGMTRDMTDEDYYVASGGKIPVKWTAPEVVYIYKDLSIRSSIPNGYY